MKISSVVFLIAVSLVAVRGDPGNRTSTENDNSVLTTEAPYSTTDSERAPGVHVADMHYIMVREGDDLVLTSKTTRDGSGISWGRQAERGIMPLGSIGSPPACTWYPEKGTRPIRKVNCTSVELPDMTFRDSGLYVAYTLQNRLDLYEVAVFANLENEEISEAPPSRYPHLMWHVLIGLLLKILDAHGPGMFFGVAAILD